MTDRLYEDVVLDHNRNPRNFGPLEAASHVAEARNPLCGDHFVVRVRLEAGRLAEVRFEGAGCAIAKASASMMTGAVTGMMPSEAATLSDTFQGMLERPPNESDDDAAAWREALGPLAVFVNVRAYPMRIRCALLAWQALRRALGTGGL